METYDFDEYWCVLYIYSILFSILYKNNMVDVFGIHIIIKAM